MERQAETLDKQCEQSGLAMKMTATDIVCFKGSTASNFSVIETDRRTGEFLQLQLDHSEFKNR